MAQHDQVLLLEENSCALISESLKNFDVSIKRCLCLEEIRNYILQKPNQVALVIFNTTKLEAHNLLKFIKEHSNSTCCILHSPGITVKETVSLMKQGCFHVFEKITSPEEIQDTISEALNAEPSSLRTTENSLDCKDLLNVVGKTSETVRIREILERIKDNSSTALIIGERGVGKKFLAQQIHRQSNRKNEPFVFIECSSLSNEELDKELFGFYREDLNLFEEGKFQKANKGTLYLSEISQMDPALQVKILKALETKKLERSATEDSAADSVEIDVRVIVSSSCDIDKLRNQIREDFYFKLCVVHFHLRPLRERLEDVPCFVETFLKNLNLKYDKNLSISDECINRMCSYFWPGNIEELKTLMEKLVFSQEEGSITKSSLPLHFQTEIKGFVPTTNISETGVDFKALLNNYETNLILKALDMTSWNRNQAANLLNMNRTTLVEKMKKKGIRQLL